MGRVEPRARLAPGPCCHCQHPSLAQGAQPETPRPLRQPPPAHELAGFLGLSLTREMSLRAENSPAEPCQGTRAHCYSCSAWGRGNFMSDSVTLGPVSQAGVSAPQRACAPSARNWCLHGAGGSVSMDTAGDMAGTRQERSPPSVVPGHSAALPGWCHLLGICW